MAGSTGISKYFVGGCNNSQTLQDYLSQFGKVISLQRPVGPDGIPKCFAFVTMEGKAKVKLGNHELSDGRKVEIKSCLMEGSAFATTKLFVRGVPQNATEEDLQIVFSKCGKVDEVIVKTDKNGNNRGFAFITFASPAAVEIASSKQFTVRGVPVEVEAKVASKTAKISKEVKKRAQIAAGSVTEEALQKEKEKAKAKRREKRKASRNPEEPKESVEKPEKKKKNKKEGKTEETPAPAKKEKKRKQPEVDAEVVAEEKPKKKRKVESTQ